MTHPTHPAHPTSDTAPDDLRYIRGVLERTQRRIDPHALHFVSWGAIVLVSYPVMNWLQNAGRLREMAIVGGVALALGIALSVAFEWRLSRRPRLEGEDTFVSAQIHRVVWGALAPAIALSATGPAIGFIDGPAVPIVWGLAYAVMAYMVGVVYRREFMWSGLAIFVGSVLAMNFVDHAGFILGPFMGLGMIVPGLMAEFRVRRLRAEDAAA